MKKKLIAAVTSLVMVATMVPATVSAAVQPAASKSAVTKAAESEAVAAAKAAIETVAGKVDESQATEIGYDKSGTALEEANKLFNALTQAEKAEIGDALAARLAMANEIYAKYTTAIKGLEDAIAVVATIEGDYDTNAASLYKKASDLYKNAKVEATDEKKPDGSGEDATIKGAELANTDLVGALNAATKTKWTDLEAAKSAVDTINTKLLPAGKVLVVDNTNYEDVNNDNLTPVKNALKNLSATQESYVGNKGLITTVERSLTKYTNAVEAVIKLNTAAYQAALNDGDTISDDPKSETYITKVEEAVAAVKVAFNQLDADKKTAVANKTADNIKADQIELAEKNIKTYHDKADAKKEATPVIEMIRKLPGSITLSDKEAIEAARAAYDALSENGKKYVKDESPFNNADSKNYLDNGLVAAETAYQTAYETMIKAKSDTERVEELTAMVKALPSVNAVTLKDEDAFTAAVEYFNLVSSTGASINTTNGTITSGDNGANWQKTFAIKTGTEIATGDAATDLFNKLVDGYKEILKLKKAANTAATEYKTTYLDKLQPYKAGDGMYIGVDTAKLNNAKYLLQEATKAFNLLKADVQEVVKALTEYAYIANTEKEIAIAEKAIANKAEAAKIDTLIKAIGITDATKLTKENLSQYEAKIQAANDAYTKATKEVQGFVTEKATLTALVDRVKELKDGGSVADVEAAIAKLPIVKTDGTETETTLLAAQKEIKAAVALFDGLASSVQATVKNAEILAKAKTALDAAALKLAQAEFAKIGDISAGITDAQIAQFNHVAELAKTFGLSTADISAHYAKIEDAIKAKDEADLKAVIDGIKALPATIAKKDVATVTALQAAYNKLKPELQEKVETKLVEKLKDAVAQADALSLEKAAVTVENVTYTGEVLRPAVTVKDAKGNLVAESEYYVVYGDYKDAGAAKLMIRATADSKYTGEKEGTYTIKAAEVKAADVTGVVSKTYTGKALTQKVVVKANGKTLKNGTDYTVSYKNNKNVGKATVTVKAKGNYTGTITKTFIVKPAKESITSLKKGTKRFTVKYKKQSGAKYQIYYKTAGSKAKTVKTSAVTKTVKNLKKGKTYTVKVRAYKTIGKDTYYGAYSAAKKVKVR